LKRASFWGSWGSIRNWLELKIKPPLADLACLNTWNTLYNLATSLCLFVSKSRSDKILFVEFSIKNTFCFYNDFFILSLEWEKRFKYRWLRNPAVTKKWLRNADNGWDITFFFLSQKHLSRHCHDNPFCQQSCIERHTKSQSYQTFFFVKRRFFPLFVVKLECL
jgi:hypothetical protein